jgi:hypothetical protein
MVDTLESALAQTWPKMQTDNLLGSRELSTAAGPAGAARDAEAEVVIAHRLG